MAKNKRKTKKNELVAVKCVDDSELLVRQGQIQGGLTAKNSLDCALRLSDWDSYNYNQSLSSFNGYNNISLEMLSLQPILLTYLYKTFGILGKIVDIPVDDAYKDGGFDLDADTIDEDEIKDLKDVLSENQDIEEIKTAQKWARLYGGAALIALTGEDLSRPLHLDSLDGKPLEFIAVDRWQITYSLPNINMRGGTWALTNYQGSWNNKIKDFNGYQRIHESRVFPVKGKKAPFLIEQQLSGWGMSVYEQIFQDMSQFFKARNVMFELLDEAKTDVLKLATLQTAISSQNGERALQKMVDMIARNKNYKSQITLSKDDEYEQKQITFSGFEGILKEIRIMMSGSANMPVNKLWGEGVTGFGSGEDSLENYNSQIENEIRTPANPLVKWLLVFRCWQIFGFEVDDLVKTWKNLRVLSAIDEQNIHDHKFANLLQLYDRQLLSPKELMIALKKQQLFIQNTKALNGELDEMPLLTQQREETEFKDITRE
nr:MAG TPA: portal [Caudoviricetes sp.]